MNVHALAGLAFVLAALIATVSPAPPESPEATPAQSEPTLRNILVMIQPEPPRAQPRFTGVCYFIHPQETLHMLVKGEPAIPQGGEVIIAGSLGEGVLAGFVGNQTAYTGDGWTITFVIPGVMPQEELVIVRNDGATAGPACFKVAYQFAPEPPSKPEHKDGNDPPARPIPPAQPRDAPIKRL